MVCSIFAIERKQRQTNKQTQTTNNQLVIKNMFFSLITVGTIWYAIFAIKKKQSNTNKQTQLLLINYSNKKYVFFVDTI